ncbi:hypothetical protein Q8A67_023269 [Cirrhinus molitorella]|uniref:Uncharacterized protein n=1 Tax=Cirrhinus molitorella TaxID=172907 RepID=A0AA88TCG1_9TELE|nr:hypothetical protein Q8A67_023269 [Cirrhinus molitorella]
MAPAVIEDRPIGALGRDGLVTDGLTYRPALHKIVQSLPAVILILGENGVEKAHAGRSSPISCTGRTSMLRSQIHLERCPPEPETIALPKPLPGPLFPQSFKRPCGISPPLIFSLSGRRPISGPSPNDELDVGR